MSRRHPLLFCLGEEVVTNKALTPGLSSVRDLHAKLQRDAAKLEKEVTSDDFFNFVVTGYSMIDWIKNDSSVPSSAKTESVVRGLYGNRWLKICGDIANSYKHYMLDPRKRTPITTKASSAQGFGLGRYSKGAFGLGEEDVDVELNDGAKFGCFELVNGVLSVWQDFFSAHGI